MAADTKRRERTAGNRRDAELALRARAGDREAQEELYHRFYPIFRNWVHSWLRFPAWDKECVDDVMANLFEELPKYRPEGSAFCSWAFMVSRSELIKHIHDLSLDHVDFPLDEILADMMPALTGPLDAYIDSRVHEEVESLDPEQGASVSGYFYEGKTETMMARELLMPRRRVCYRIHQGLAELRKRLNDVAFTRIRPQIGFFRNSYVMTNARENVMALLGGEEGDYA